jgi:hypothetical protein
MNGMCSNTSNLSSLRNDDKTEKTIDIDYLLKMDHKLGSKYKETIFIDAFENISKIREKSKINKISEKDGISLIVDFHFIFTQIGPKEWKKLALENIEIFGDIFSNRIEMEKVEDIGKVFRLTFFRYLLAFFLDKQSFLEKADLFNAYFEKIKKNFNEIIDIKSKEAGKATLLAYILYMEEVESDFDAEYLSKIFNLTMDKGKNLEGVKEEYLKSITINNIDEFKQLYEDLGKYKLIIKK